jgi:hypothetical protein
MAIAKSMSLLVALKKSVILGKIKREKKIETGSLQ